MKSVSQKVLKVNLSVQFSVLSRLFVIVTFVCVFFTNLGKSVTDSDITTSSLWFQREPEQFTDHSWRMLLSGVDILFSKKMSTVTRKML